MPQVIMIQLIYSTKTLFFYCRIWHSWKINFRLQFHDLCFHFCNAFFCFFFVSNNAIFNISNIHSQTFVLHLYFTCVLTIYYYIEYVTLVYYGTKVVTNFSYNLNLAHLIQYSYIYIKHSHCYDFHVGVLFSLKWVY